MVYKQANNTKTNKKKIKQGMIVRTAILYIIFVNVPEDYSLLQYTIVDIQPDHSIRHCTPSLSVSHKLFPTTLYTVTVRVQQVHSLLHCTQSLSMCNKTIPFYTVHSHCQCATRPFPFTLYTVTASVQQDHSKPHSTKSNTVNVQQDHSLPHSIKSLSASNKIIPHYTVHSVSVQ